MRALFAFCLLALAAGCAPRVEKAPHIVVLIADDLGLDHAPCHSAEVKMPFLESLCGEAVVYVRAYTHPYCTPSRATMMTGRHTFRTGAGDVRFDAAKLPLEEITLPEHVRATSPAPYRFAAFGKWHLADDGNGGPANPNLQGFDHFEGTPTQRQTYSYFDYDWVRNGEIVGPGEAYRTTKIADAVLHDFSREHEAAPQFYWVGFVNPHLPFHTPPYKLHSQPHLPQVYWRSAAAPGPGAFRLQDRDARLDPYFDAMLEALDTELERIVNTIQATTERPVVFVFLGDNGTSAEVYQGDASGGYRAKASLYEGGVRAPLMIWSNNNEALGLRPGRRGTLVHLADLFPTLSSQAGATSPSHAIDGVDFSATLFDPAAASSRAFAYLERGNHARMPFAYAAVDAEGFKLILREPDRPTSYAAGVLIELYDTTRDPGEVRNLMVEDCAANLARAQALFAFLDSKLAQDTARHTSYDHALYAPLVEPDACGRRD
ncbi:MAG: sulfatase-like hydrolase/transferase [Pseudomonadota bacterium]